MPIHRRVTLLEKKSKIKIKDSAGAIGSAPGSWQGRGGACRRRTNVTQTHSRERKEQPVEDFNSDKKLVNRWTEHKQEGRTHTNIHRNKTLLGHLDKTHPQTRLQLAGIEQTHKQQLSGSAQPVFSCPPHRLSLSTGAPSLSPLSCWTRRRGKKKTTQNNTLPVWHITLLAHDQTT